MAKKKFNPSEWLPQQQQKPQPTAISLPQSANETPNVQEAHIEFVVQQIEAAKLDITSNYANWRDIGFALVSALGEYGRALFHRISVFYPGYSVADCDDQYNKCLKATGHGITIRSFFHHAKSAGISISSNSTKDAVDTNVMETLPDAIYDNLPVFLKKVVAIATSSEERDLLLLGTIVAISACLNKVFGIYDGRKVFANLYLFVTALASAGKGRMVHCKQIVLPVHKAMREQAKLFKQQYELELADYNAKKGKEEGVEKPGKPPEKMLIIPANNSSTGVFQLLSDSEGKGLLFETEGDTLAQAFKTDYGNYSDGFRKAFHHETISYYRRTDREYVDIDNPCLSAVLTGTPKQVAALIPNAENGLFSRFIFYFMNVRPVWKDVFADHSDNGLDNYFDELGAQFYRFYQSLQAGGDIQFCLSADQKARFNSFFAEVQNTYLNLLGLDYMATVRRLGLIAFRISMIFSAMRIMESGDASDKIVCEERDFNAAIQMVKVLLKHSSKVFSELPEETKPVRRKNRKEKFMETLPQHFNRQKYLEVAQSMAIPDKTAEGYITEFLKKGLIHREHQDHYVNLTIQSTGNSNQ